MFAFLGGLAEVLVLNDMWRKYLKKHLPSLLDGRPA
jgi:hypothetical protein